MLQAIVGIVDGKLSPNEIASNSRIHLEDGVLRIEGNIFDTGFIKQLEQRLNISVVSFSPMHFYFGGLHVVGYEEKANSEKIIFGAGDLRRSGIFLQTQRQQ